MANPRPAVIENAPGREILEREDLARLDECSAGTSVDCDSRAARRGSVRFYRETD